MLGSRGTGPRDQADDDFAGSRTHRIFQLRTTHPQVSLGFRGYWGDSPYKFIKGNHSFCITIIDWLKLFEFVNAALTTLEVITSIFRLVPGQDFFLKSVFKLP